MQEILNLFSVLDKKFKKVFKLLIFVFFTSFLQFFLLSSIVLVISIMVDPNLIFENKYFMLIYQLGFQNENNF